MLLVVCIKECYSHLGQFAKIWLEGVKCLFLCSSAEESILHLLLRLGNGLGKLDCFRLMPKVWACYIDLPRGALTGATL